MSLYMNWMMICDVLNNELVNIIYVNIKGFVENWNGLVVLVNNFMLIWLLLDEKKKNDILDRWKKRL